MVLGVAEGVVPQSVASASLQFGTTGGVYSMAKVGWIRLGRPGSWMGVPLYRFCTP